MGSDCGSKATARVAQYAMGCEGKAAKQARNTHTHFLQYRAAAGRRCVNPRASWLESSSVNALLHRQGRCKGKAAIEVANEQPEGRAEQVTHNSTWPEAGEAHLSQRSQQSRQAAGRKRQTISNSSQDRGIRQSRVQGITM